MLAVAPDLPRKLAETLPVDEFRIVLAPHPNIRAGHSAWQLTEYLAAAVRAGVHVPDDIDAWRTAIVSADLVIGDHGSVGFYSTALGNPLLLAAAPKHTVDPRSPIARLISAAPPLDPTGDLATQVHRSMADHDPQRYSAITALTTSEPDVSARILRTEMYRTLRLPEPDQPAELSALPLPRHRLNGPDSHLVVAELGTDRTATITRFPAERLRFDSATPRGAHLAIGVDEPRRRWLELADIAIGTTGSDTQEWITATLASLPGCALASAPLGDRRWLLGNDANEFFTVNGSDIPCRMFASVAYQWLVAGGNANGLAGHWRIHCAGRTHRVDVSRATC
ncbi:hypothetical protein AB0E01_35260 [Nocardia vinacea]|uniref:hypothetical protein n=1 Tax=Nocardia vinacea TaxID=96468 RepID=UPI0033DEB6CD